MYNLICSSQQPCAIGTIIIPILQMKTWWHGEDKQFTLRLQSQLQGIQSLSYSNFKWILTYKSIEPPCGTLETNIILEINYTLIKVIHSFIHSFWTSKFSPGLKEWSLSTQWLGHMERRVHNAWYPGPFLCGEKNTENYSPVLILESGLSFLGEAIQ